MPGRSDSRSNRPEPSSPKQTSAMEQEEQSFTGEQRSKVSLKPGEDDEEDVPGGTAGGSDPVSSG